MSRGWAASLGVGALGLACCAGLPALLAAVGGLTLAGVAGLSGAAAGVVLVVVVIGLRLRRRRAANPPGGS